MKDTVGTLYQQCESRVLATLEEVVGRKLNPEALLARSDESVHKNQTVRDRS